MNRMELCNAAKKFAEQLEQLSAGGNVNALLSPDNLVVGEKSIALKNTVPPPPGTPAGIYPGFSAPEAYTGGTGPAAGVYFVGAVIYMLMNGGPPPDAQSRAGAPAIAGAADPLSQLVNQAMEPNPALRIGNFTALKNGLGAVHGQLQAAQPAQAASVQAAPAAAAGVAAGAAMASAPSVPPASSAAPAASASAVPPPSSPAASPVQRPAGPAAPAAPYGAQQQPQPMGAAAPRAGMVPPGAPPQQGGGAPPPQYMGPRPMAPQGMAPPMQPQGPAGQPPRPMVPPPGAPGMYGAQPPKAKKKRTGLKVAIIVAAVVLVLGGGFFGYTMYQRSNADTAYTEGRYADYMSAMDAAPWLKNDEENLRYDYSSARALEEDGDQSGALDAYDALGSYEDSTERANSIRYEMATEMMDSGDLSGALELFNGLGRYQDSSDMAYDIQAYLDADALSDPLDRYYAFSDLGGFLDSADQAAAAAGGMYDQAVTLYNEGSFSEAQTIFDLIPDYQNSSRYSYACDLSYSYYYSNLSELEALEQEGIYVGHILLSSSYYRGFWDGTWVSSDGGGTYWYSSSDRQFNFEDLTIGGSSYTYVESDTSLVPDSSDGNLIIFGYVDYNTMTITVQGYGTYTYYRQ